MLFLHARNLDDGCEYTVRLPSSGHTSLSGLIPTGRTEFALGEQGEPIATLDVSTKSNVVIVDLSDRGGVRVSLACTDGDPCRGPARFEVRSRKHSIVGSAFFHRAPYALYGLAEGEYSLTVHQPYGRTDSHAHTLPFRVIPGQVVETACLPFDGKEPWEDP